MSTKKFHILNVGTSAATLKGCNFMKLSKWLEQVLNNYYGEQWDRVAVMRTVYESPGSSGGNSSTNPADQSVFIRDISLELCAEDKGSLRAVAHYELGGFQRTENLILQVSERNGPGNRPSTGRILVSLEREVDVYTRLFPRMEALVSVCPGLETLGIPKCYFGQYEPPESESQAELDIQGAFGFPPANSPSILVFQDLKTMGFNRKPFREWFTNAEVKAVLRELARIHVVSWVLQFEDFQELGQTYSFLVQPSDVTLGEAGLGPFIKTIRNRTENTFENRELVRRLKEFLPKMRPKFDSLIRPPSGKLPSTLIHYNLVHQSIFFRNTLNAVRMRNGKIYDHRQIECRIANWQIAGIGSPLHDVAFFLLTCVNPELRRMYTDDFLPFYYEKFQENAKKFELQVPFEMKELETEYERSFLFAMLLIIGNVTEDNCSSIDPHSFNILLEGARDLVKDNLI